MIFIYLPASIQAAEWKTLKAGDKGYEVYALKLLLLHRNCEPGEAGVVFDAKTARALTAFQTQNGLDPTGQASPETWEKLISQVSAGQSALDDNAVKAAQYLLRNKYAFTALNEDGKFDLETKAAVLLFQCNYKLGTNGANGMDGAIGANTWSCLIRDSKKENNYGWVICVELNMDRGILGTLYAYGSTGHKILEMPCLGQSMTMNTDWRSEYGNTPLGCFRASISYKWRDWMEYGKYYSIELNDEDVRAVTNGRDRILIHSGHNKYKQRPDYGLPYWYKDYRARNIQGLDQTHGCIRISNDDHARLYNSLKGCTKGIVSISEHVFD